MRKKLEKSFIERIGLDNEELKTSEHDLMMLKWSKDENLEKLFYEWCKPDLEEGIYWSLYNMGEKKFLGPKGKILSTINGKKKFLGPKGKILSTINGKKVFIHTNEEFCKKEIEKMIRQPNGFVVGYVDIFVFFDVLFSLLTETKEEAYTSGTVIDGFAVIELKPEISNYGALLRQIKTYRDFLEEGSPSHKVYAFVITNQKVDQKWIDLFKQQGVFLYSDIEKVLEV